MLQKIRSDEKEIVLVNDLLRQEHSARNYSGAIIFIEERFRSFLAYSAGVTP